MYSDFLLFFKVTYIFFLVPEQKNFGDNPKPNITTDLGQQIKFPSSIFSEKYLLSIWGKKALSSIVFKMFLLPLLKSDITTDLKH